MPLVSVIMPALQAEKYIDKAIQSVVDQVFVDWELIVVDDGSCDRTAAIVTQWTMRDQRIHLFSNPQTRGAARSRNHAIDHATGELIAFLDADDLAYPQRLQQQVQYLQQHPQVGLAAHWLDIIDENGMLHPVQWQWRKEKDTHLPVFLLFGNAFALSAVMMRRGIWLQLKGFQPDFEPCEDYALWTDVAQITGVHILPQKLGARREHRNSWTNRAADRSSLQTARIVTAHLKAIGVEPTEAQLHLHQQLRHRQFEKNNDFARAAKNWLGLLLQKNQQKRRYSPEAMTEVLAEIWYDYWHLRHAEGLAALKQYFNSPLWQANGLRKNGLLIALCIRAFLR
ncbi:glycosyltransferase family 2 protein [Rhodoflexus sp.]